MKKSLFILTLLMLLTSVTFASNMEDSFMGERVILEKGFIEKNLKKATIEAHQIRSDAVLTKISILSDSKEEIENQTGTVSYIFEFPYINVSYPSGMVIVTIDSEADEFVYVDPLYDLKWVNRNVSEEYLAFMRDEIANDYNEVMKQLAENDIFQRDYKSFSYEITRDRASCSVVFSDDFVHYIDDLFIFKRDQKKLEQDLFNTVRDLNNNKINLIYNQWVDRDGFNYMYFDVNKNLMYIKSNDGKRELVTSYTESKPNIYDNSIYFYDTNNIAITRDGTKKYYDSAFKIIFLEDCIELIYDYETTSPVITYWIMR